jgi:tetratricopeptide (TPR) repeat protein
MIDSKRPDVSALPIEVVQLLSRCEGFVELKMPDRADQELDAISPEFQQHFYVRWLRVAVLQVRKSWSEALPLALALRDECPTDAGFWIQLAYITRRAENIEAARTILNEAMKLFPDDGTIRYNMACYACQLGRLDEARKLLLKAIAADESWRKAALNDDDLQELHDELEGDS